MRSSAEQAQKAGVWSTCTCSQKLRQRWTLEPIRIERDSSAHEPARCLDCTFMCSRAVHVQYHAECDNAQEVEESEWQRNAHLTRNWHWCCRLWPVKHVKKKLLARSKQFLSPPWTPEPHLYWSGWAPKICLREPLSQHEQVKLEQNDNTLTLRHLSSVE